MSNQSVARRYSTALADAVIAGGSAETVRSEISQWAEMFNASPELSAVFSNPAISHADKEKIVESIIAKVSPSMPTANFVRILARNGRLSEIGEIDSKFKAVLDERSGLASAQVISARELPDTEKAEFVSQLEKMTGKRVSVTFDVDPDLIGGAITRIGSTVFDGSVRSKLENLREQLIDG